MGSFPKLRTREAARSKLPLYNEKVVGRLQEHFADALSDDDGWQTESSFDDSRSPSSEYSASAYMIPKHRQGERRLPQRNHARLYRLPNRVMRYLCFAMMAGLVLFILLLIRASRLENAVIASGHAKDRLPPSNAPRPPKAWQSFPFLRRYYGGLKTLVPLAENEPEFPRAENVLPVDEFNTTIHPVPDSKPFSTYPGAGIDTDIAECYIDEAKKSRVPSLQYYDGRPSGFPSHVYGSYEIFGLPEDICFERYGKLGPYGIGYSTLIGGTGAGIYGDQEGSAKVWPDADPIDYSDVDWADVQRRCYRANAQRFPVVSTETKPVGFFIDDDSSSRSTNVRTPTFKLDDSQEGGAEHKIPRSALVLRCWDSFFWREEDILNLRSLISELSLTSGGRYDVHLLVQVKDDGRYPVLADGDAYRQRIMDSIPREFQGIATLWTVTQMLAIYQGVYDTWIKGPDLPIHGAYRGLQMALQHFSTLHPEYEYVWHWEMDLRYTGHYLDFLTKTESWARLQPRKGLWERSERFYFPSVHGSWDDFHQITRMQAELNPQDFLPTVPGREASPVPSVPTPIWGPVRPADPADIFDADNDPVPPHSYDKDNYEWGVGEEADLITFSPIFDPQGTTWGLRDDITGYNSSEGLPPRRAHIITASRMSRRLLSLMHRETAFKKHFAFSEMWPATVALQHGLKAVYAPHPVFVDRDWPIEFMATTYNGGKSSAVGGARSTVYGDKEHNLMGVTFFYNSGFGTNLWQRWLGLRVNNDGGEGFETTRDESKNGKDVGSMKGGEGRMCLPPMLLHPVRDILLPLELIKSPSNLHPSSDPSL